MPLRMSSLGDGPNEMNDALAYLNLGSGRTAKQISCGYHQTCTLLDNDQVCYAANNSVIVIFAPSSC